MVAFLAYVTTWLVNRSLRDVEGTSMLPTLRPGDRLLVAPRWLRPPHRGSLVVVSDPRQPDRRTVKRVAGLPGDRVEGGDDQRWELGAGQLVVLGDNRDGSTDSRTYGPVNVADVRATVLARVRPWRWLGGARGRRATGA